MLCSNTRAHRDHTSCLEKGVTLIHRDVELSGEGTGFGVPVLRCLGRDYFSSSSTIQTSHRHNTIAIKSFNIDTVLERNLKGARPTNKIARNLVRRLERLYQTRGNWTWLALKKSVLKTLGVKTSFMQVKPLGTVPVVYHFEGSRVKVKADFSSLKRNGLERIFLLNEQASTHFTKYHDSDGTILTGQKIGPWQKVHADWASFSTDTGEIGFRLWNVKDAIMYRGREFLKNTFDWTGLDYEIRPEKTSFEYDVEITEGTGQ